ncbi:hypothetical protein TWF788_000797 [Orbilia oligospora]|uniref:Uncharacterized protein n=1 Tax=Orbilia oligospora TaxID=2813651 RepID=A0A7C8KE86_ORBOL|nr:hypothetical protein TWF788_000797 [Orbilia oligospora]
MRRGGLASTPTGRRRNIPLVTGFAYSLPWAPYRARGPTPHLFPYLCFPGLVHQYFEAPLNPRPSRLIEHEVSIGSHVDRPFSLASSQGVHPHALQLVESEGVVEDTGFDPLGLDPPELVEEASLYPMVVFGGPPEAIQGEPPQQSI